MGVAVTYIYISELEMWSWFRPYFLQISKWELEPTHTPLLWEGREEVRIVRVRCPEHPFTRLCRGGGAGEPYPACGTHLMMSVELVTSWHRVQCCY